MNGVSAYPLQWPAGRKRTPSYQVRSSAFKVPSFAVARDGLLDELKRLKARNVVLSTNVSLRNDGLPYANQRQPDDCGVAVYYTDKKGKQVCFSCDCWRKIEENMRAIEKTIEALRGVERWGSGDMMEAAFSGFAALPATSQDQPWWEILKVTPLHAQVDVEASYRRLVMFHHPDRGGSNDAMATVNRAYEQFKKERGLS